MPRSSRWIIAVASMVAASGAGELYLRGKGSSETSEQTNYSRLLEIHAPYSVRHPHPDYTFFFAGHSGDDTVGPGTIQIAGGGFRGPGPEHANGRALAFLVGNSVVFGFAPHDSLTITGILNRIQNRFFFVNAGAPSWVSSQMRRRIIDELLDHRPALVVFWGGYNDASLAYRDARSGRDFDPAMTERPTEPMTFVDRLIQGLLPNLLPRLTQLAMRVVSPPRSVGHGIANDAANAFVTNLTQAYDASSAAGSRFLAVYQPVLYYHAGRPPRPESEERRIFLDRFRSHVLLEVQRSRIPLLDLGDVFDKYYALVPVFTPGRGPDLREQAFVDEVHLYVPGNQVVAREIAVYVASSFSGLE